MEDSSFVIGRRNVRRCSYARHVSVDRRGWSTWHPGGRMRCLLCCVSHLATLRRVGALAIGAVVLMVGVVAGPVAAIPQADDPAEATRCGGSVETAATPSRQINLVLDDSGSMFADRNGRLDRWSFAKYSLSVFAAMMDANDTLNVYRMSDFDTEGGQGTRGPILALSGSESPLTRVTKIEDMQLQGGDTPYDPIPAAVENLKASGADQTWLVVLSDGEFDNRKTPQVAQDISRWVDESQSEDSGLQVAFLAIGNGAPSIPDEPDRGIHFARAARSSDLLSQMTGFSNLIFQRDIIVQDSTAQIEPDIALAEALVFAQGQDVSIGSAQTSAGTIEPVSVVPVKWTPNQSVNTLGRTVEALPNEDLVGQLALYQSLPKGPISFDVSGAESIDVFYKPQVDFGARITDLDGNPVDPAKMIGGDYRIEYGFMDENCEFIDSELLGEPNFTARVYQDGEVIADKFQSGDSVPLQRGDFVLETTGTYLDGGRSSARITFSVRQPAPPPGLKVSEATYLVSKLNDYQSPADAITVTYGEKQGDGVIPFSPEVWDTVTRSTFKVESPTNITFDISIGEEVGEIFLLPRPPGGDVYAANTGEIPFTITAVHTFEGQMITASLSSSTTVEDDLSTLDRLLNWLATVGWKLLLLLLALLVLLGYVFKPRFSRRIKERPTITGSPKGLGRPPEPGKGSFRKNAFRKFMPFVADKATLVYVPAAARGSFRPMKLRALRGRGIAVLNAREIGKRGNVSINGTDLTEGTSTPPRLSPSSIIAATTADTTYEMTLNN